MPQLESKTTKAILRRPGAPQEISPDEQCQGAEMDDVDRSSFPEIENIDNDFVPNGSKGFGSSGQKRGDGQPGTT